jgi:uncharacterized membrane protein YeaQ/YmgE (transglycosylase-associated protein family)
LGLRGFSSGRNCMGIATIGAVIVLVILSLIRRV